MNLHDITPAIPEWLLAITGSWYEDHWTHGRHYPLRYSWSRNLLEYKRPHDHTGAWHRFSENLWSRWQTMRGHDEPHPEILEIVE